MIFFSHPPSTDEIIEFGQSLSVKRKLKVLVWNIYKGKKADFKKEFLQQVKNCDIFLLQEIVTSDEILEVLKTDQNISWIIGSSFEYNHNKIKTGVAIGSRIPIEAPQLVRGSENELLIWTPKVSLIAENKELDLMIISTHFVNFTTTARFKSFLEELLEKIAHFKGKILLAGDFNTWNFKRWHQLLNGLEANGIKHYAFERDGRLLKLDHLFFKGIQVHSAQILHQTQGSDHYPMLFEIEV